MKILGKYPRFHSEFIRVNYRYFKIHDRVVIDFDTYFIIARCLFGTTILLDRPLERATDWHESIVFYDTPV